MTVAGCVVVRASCASWITVPKVVCWPVAHAAVELRACPDPISLSLSLPALPHHPPHTCAPSDDFGWGDLHSYGHATQERGNIDMMAEQGVRFTQWYSAESICTPSRMGQSAVYFLLLLLLLYS